MIKLQGKIQTGHITKKGKLTFQKRSSKIFLEWTQDSYTHNLCEVLSPINNTHTSRKNTRKNILQLVGIIII